MILRAEILHKVQMFPQDMSLRFQAVFIQIPSTADVMRFIHTDVNNIRGKRFPERCDHTSQQGLYFGISGIEDIIDIFVFVRRRFPHKKLIKMRKALNARD